MFLRGKESVREKAYKRRYIAWEKIKITSSTILQFLFCFSEQLKVNIKTEIPLGLGTRTALVRILITRMESCGNLHEGFGSVRLYLKGVWNFYCQSLLLAISSCRAHYFGVLRELPEKSGKPASFQAEKIIEPSFSTSKNPCGVFYQETWSSTSVQNTPDCLKLLWLMNNYSIHFNWIYRRNRCKTVNTKECLCMLRIAMS